jgi:competence protein ComFC
LGGVTARQILDALFPAQCSACGAVGSGLCAVCAPAAALPLHARVGRLRVAAYGAYEGALRTAVLALKDGRRDVAEALAQRIAPLIPPDSVVVPVPTTPRRRRMRGIDGVALVARHLAGMTGARVFDVLRQRAGDAQRGRSRGQRLAAQNRFTCDDAVAGHRVTLIDDVCTTGATLTDCARAVESANGEIAGAVVAALTKTPRTWGPNPPN